MNDMKIAIACKNDDLRKLVYTLFPDHDPANLMSFLVVDELIQAMNRGHIEIVILDEGFEDPDREFATMVELGRARMPVVALMPRAPSFAEPASDAFERTAIASRAVRLDLPTTAEGMEIAIRGAIDNREDPGIARGPDYGRARAWPGAWKDEGPAGVPAMLKAEEQGRRAVEEITGGGAFRHPEPPAPPDQDPIDEKTDYGERGPAQREREERARNVGVTAPAPEFGVPSMPTRSERVRENAEFRRRVGGIPDPGVLPAPDPDPMDALIEAAKAIVVETAGNAGDFDQGIRTWMCPVPKDHLVALAKALNEAGYSPW